MGGYGSGRYKRFGKKPKDTVESAKCLDIRQLSPKPTLGQQEAQIDNGQIIKLVWTNCNYGGQRPWFICPKCLRRVGKLSDRNHSLRGLSLLFNLYTKEAKTKFFRCRKCLNLAYELLEMEIMTQQMLEFDKIMYSLAKLTLNEQ